MSIPCTTGLYEWLFTIGLRTSGDCLGSAMALTLFSLVGFIGGIVHGVTRRVHDPRLRWHKNLLTLATHQTGKLLGIGSLAWAGHLVHVALPGSRGIRIGWLQLLTFLPSPHGLLPLLTGNWELYAEHPDRLPHVFGRLDSATGSAILTFTGSYSPRSGSLWLSDVAHHHLAVGIVALLVSSFVIQVSLGPSSRGSSLIDHQL